MKLLKIPAHI